MKRKDAPKRCWQAHRTQRWHTNPRLAKYGQTLADHAHGVATLVMHLHPAPSTNLIAYALLHDAGEHVMGDIPGPAKSKMPDDTKRWFNAREQQEAERVYPDWFDDDFLTEEDRMWVKLGDMLEAFIWAEHHDSRAIDGTFAELHTEIFSLADKLGGRRLAVAVEQLVGGTFTLEVT